MTEGGTDAPPVSKSRRRAAYYSAFFPSAFTFAHLALAIAASLAFTAALTLRTAFLAGFFLALAQRAFTAAIMAALPFALSLRLPVLAGFPARTLAHRALAAAAILARPAADIRPRRPPRAGFANGIGDSLPLLDAIESI